MTFITGGLLLKTAQNVVHHSDVKPLFSNVETRGDQRTAYAADASATAQAKHATSIEAPVRHRINGTNATDCAAPFWL